MALPPFTGLLTPLLLLPLLISSSSSPLPSQALPGCPERCGNITVFYPFGIGRGCYRKGFGLLCTTDDPPSLLMTNGQPVLDISLDGELTIEVPVVRRCNTSDSKLTWVGIDLVRPYYTFSYTRNRMVVVGCNALAINYNISIGQYVSGCFTLCQDRSSIMDGSCEGIGCCETAILKGLKRLDIRVGAVRNQTTLPKVPPCNYAFLVDQRRFTFKASDLDGLSGRNATPVVLDWAVGTETCRTAGESADYACGTNSYCSESTNGEGYRCNCEKGYRGNPYIFDGCRDINECEETSNPCSHICTNTEGSLRCSCPKGKYGDGLKNGKGCINDGSIPSPQIILGCVLSSLFFIIIALIVYLAWMKRRRVKKKRKYFIQHGGELFQQGIQTRVFSLDELEKATGNFHQELGNGAFGVVYKGRLSNGMEIAVKKFKKGKDGKQKHMVKNSKKIENNPTDQFVKEIAILSQVSHRNMVTLIGCCLETKVPLLVFEFVQNGTLYDRIHDGPPLTWDDRMKIAAEAAHAIFYLHYEASCRILQTTTPMEPLPTLIGARQILHADIKSKNILLDQNYAAKVSDFGISELVSLDLDELITNAKGTVGYMDPEFIASGKLTAKSDVYSFGVVLAELLTGQEAGRLGEQGFLSHRFRQKMETDDWFSVLDSSIREDEKFDELTLKSVADLTVKCLMLEGSERPTMREVAATLDHLIDTSATGGSSTAEKIHGSEHNEDAILADHHGTSFRSIDGATSSTTDWLEYQR